MYGPRRGGILLLLLVAWRMNDGISCLHIIHSNHKSITDYVQVNKVFSSAIHRITSLSEIFYFVDEEGLL